MINCRVCNDDLTNENWYPCFKKTNNKICKKCCINKGKERRLSLGIIPRSLCGQKCNKCGIELTGENTYSSLGNCSICIDCHKKNSKERCLGYKKTVMMYYSNGTMKCACCGETHIEFLTIDHINNDGAKHRKDINSGGGHSFYRWLINNNFPQGYRVLCFNCNCSLGMYGYCPHQKGESK